MATLGATGKPSTTQEYTGLNSKNQQASKLTMPAGGPWNITHVGAWLAGVNGDSPTVKLAVWSATRGLRRATAGFTAPSLAFSLGNANEYYKPLTSPLQVNGGDDIWVGWARDPAEDLQWPMRSGTHYDDTQTGSWPADMAGETSHSGEIGVYITYVAASVVPNKPINRTPVGGARLTNNSIPGDMVQGTIPITFDHDDDDGDPILGYDLKVDNNSGVTSPEVNIVDSQLGITGNHVARNVTADVPRGQTRYWQARTRDKDGWGDWSSILSFKVNTLPVAAPTSPTAGKWAEIHNLATDLAVWTSGGAHAKPRLKWSFTDADGDAQASYRVRIYNASTGTEGDASQVHDSGIVNSANKQHDATWAGVRGTQYWWTINVKDAYGEWSGESARTAFKMVWGQAIYEYSVPGGSTSAQWNFVAGAVSNGVAAFLFAGATGAAGAGRSAWVANIGGLTPAAYLNVMVRLANAANASSLAASVPDMTFSYLANGVTPDLWVPGGAAGDWALDSQVRRYGSQSYRLARTAATNARWIYPFTKDAGDDVSVTSYTEYTFSAYVNTGKAAIGSAIGLYVFAAGADPATAAELSDLYIDSTKRSTLNSTGKGTEDWQRLVLRFRTAGQDRLRLVLMQPAAGALATDKVWVDAAQLEEAIMPTPWKPGAVGEAAVLDVGGIVLDASAGAIFRLRGRGVAPNPPGARDMVHLGDQGLVFGGDTPLTSDATSVLRAAGIPLMPLGYSGGGRTGMGLNPVPANNAWGQMTGGSQAFLGEDVTWNAGDYWVVNRAGLYLVIYGCQYSLPGVDVTLAVGAGTGSAGAAPASPGLPNFITFGSALNDNWAMYSMGLRVLAVNSTVGLFTRQNSASTTRAAAQGILQLLRVGA